jgi:hypothetical protein
VHVPNKKKAPVHVGLQAWSYLLIYIFFMFRVDGIFILKNKGDFETREVSKKLDLKIYILTYLNIKTSNKYCKNHKEFKNSKKKPEKKNESMK